MTDERESLRGGTTTTTTRSEHIGVAHSIYVESCATCTDTQASSRERRIGDSIRTPTAEV
jgi:hypothetical protein